MVFNEIYMRRALELAALGRGSASPNPMVGAVIVAPDGRIIGEGWHRRCGHAHAEVNAVRSLADSDRFLLPDSTIYVTLEPCAHYGKTPPCATMLVDEGIRRVVIASVDPFAKVCGRGIAILRDAGCEVVTGVLDEEARRLNAKFFTAHGCHRPWITLKWAMSADGWMDCRRNPGDAAPRFSTPLSSVAVHRLRASHDAIAVGMNTILNDSPRLTLRLWPGDNPERLVFADRELDRAAENLLHDIDAELIDLGSHDINDVLASLYGNNITSVLVEGGPRTLGAFIGAGLWDMARVEVSPSLLGGRGRAKAPVLPTECVATDHFGQNVVNYYSNNPLADVKNL